MTVLLDVKSCQIQFFAGLDLLRIFCCFCRLRNLCDLLFQWSKFYKFSAFCIEYTNRNVCLILYRKADFLLIYGYRRNICDFFEYHFPLLLQNYFCILFHSCCINAKGYFAVVNLHIYHGINAGILYITNFLVWHKILLECFFLKRFQPCEVRLVVCVDTCHQLDVWAVFICKVSIPGFSEISASPCPLFLTRGNMMICYMKDSCFLSVIVSTYKVKVRFLCHIRGRNRNVFVAGNVHTCAVIMFIIYTCSNREFGYITFSMVHNCMYIRWENRLCIVVYRYCRVCPPQESLCHWCTVVELSADLDICFVRIQSEACNSFCSVHLVYIIDHNSLAAVFMFGNCVVYRLISSRTMVLWPVKFNTAGNPRSGQAYQSRFDHMITIYEIISICFVICTLDSAAKFRENHYFDVLVFQIYCFPCFVLLDIFDFLNYRIRIHSS